MMLVVIAVMALAVGILGYQDKRLDQMDEATHADRARIYCAGHPMDIICKRVKP